ncbi:MAG: Asp23/Gls24 family envelope stress response protein [Gaiellaceae bacterium]
MKGEITITDGAVAQIVIRAAESVEGVRVRRGTARRKPAIELPRVELEIAVEYGRVLPEVALDVQRRVIESVARMCEVDATVYVTVAELDT